MLAFTLLFGAFGAAFQPDVTMIVGKIYSLDGNLYRCIKVYGFGPCRFMKLNPDGSEMEPERKGGFVVDHRTRTIFNRLDEMIEV